MGAELDRDTKPERPVRLASFVSDKDSISTTSSPKEPDAAVVAVAPSALLDSAMGAASAITLSELEGLAFANNPTLRQLEASTRKAAGYRNQVGLRLNPIVGYQGVQLADRGTDQHTAFIEQQIVTANKLALNRQVLNAATKAQLWELETQRYRIQTDIRMKFYEALANQNRVTLINDFQQLASRGVKLAELRKEAKEGSLIEVLQSKILLSEVELSRRQAEVAYAANWRELAAIAGVPQLSPSPLSGDLVSTLEPVDWASLGATLLSDSPEYKVALTRVQQSKANLQRQGVQSIPNWTVQLGAGKDNGTDSGMINLQVGAPIPVFNQNQGNIEAAKADYCRALAEVQRLENSIQARLAAISQDFDSSRAAVETYEAEILPDAKKTLELAEMAYVAGEFSFLEVFVVRKTYFESKLQYLTAQSQLAQAGAKATGFLLTGALDPTNDQSGDDSLRGLTTSQQ